MGDARWVPSLPGLASSCAGGPRNAKLHDKVSAHFVSIRAAERIVRVHYRAIAREYLLKNQAKRRGTLPAYMTSSWMLGFRLCGCKVLVREQTLAGEKFP